MAEFTQFTITDDAYDVASLFVEEGWFSQRNDVGIFAAAYTIRKHFDDVDPSELHYVGSHNYNYSAFDESGIWERTIGSLYDTETPRAYFRNLIIWGLEDIGKQIKETGIIQISDYI